MSARAESWFPEGLKAQIFQGRKRVERTLQTVAGDHLQRTKMWWTIALTLLALWMLGVATGTAGSAIHVLLGGALALLALLWLRKRPIAMPWKRR